MSSEASESLEVPDRATTETVEWLTAHNVGFDTPTFWLVAGLLDQYRQSGYAQALEDAVLELEAGNPDGICCAKTGRGGWFVREIRALAEKGGKAMSNTGAQSTQEVFRERAYKSADLAAKLYDADADIRLDMLPVIGIDDLEQLEQFGKGPVCDGYLISKSACSRLCDLGLAARWNGMNFITQGGMAVLDTLKSRVLKEKAAGR